MTMTRPKAPRIQDLNSNELRLLAHAFAGIDTGRSAAAKAMLDSAINEMADRQAAEFKADPPRFVPAGGAPDFNT